MQQQDRNRRRIDAVWHIRFAPATASGIERLAALEDRSCASAVRRLVNEGLANRGLLLPAAGADRAAGAA